jgi:uncharacterized protein (DUF1501 family)
MIHAAASGAASEAGKGLPDIEPGMPEPAGTGLSRRSLLLRGAGLALAVYGSRLALPVFDSGIAKAAQPDRILVSIFLDGGLDAMSLLAPTGDPAYRRLRPKLALGEDKTLPFTEDERLRWHPSARGIARLHGEGKVSVFPAISYSGPDQSHFTSRHFYEIGEVEVGRSTGWLGRYLDLVGDPDNPLQGLSLDRALSPSLATSAMPVASLTGADGFAMSSRLAEPVNTELFDSFRRLGDLPSDSPGMAQLRTTTRRTAKLREELTGLGAFTPPGLYPGGAMATRLALLADYIGRGLPIRVATLAGAGGYDTHANQASTLAANVRSTSDSIFAFQRDLEARGLADRVLIQVWSEFGRRPQENASGGTDHGAAGCALLIGTRAAGTMVGEFPGLAKLDRLQNLRYTSDFRAMYCSILEQWFGQDAAPVIPGASRFERPLLVKP